MGLKIKQKQDKQTRTASVRITDYEENVDSFKGRDGNEQSFRIPVKSVEMVDKCGLWCANEKEVEEVSQLLEKGEPVKVGFSISLSEKGETFINLRRSGASAPSYFCIICENILIRKSCNWFHCIVCMSVIKGTIYFDKLKTEGVYAT